MESNSCMNISCIPHSSCRLVRSLSEWSSETTWSSMSKTWPLGNNLQSRVWRKYKQRERERDVWHAKYFGNDQFRLINVSIACSMTRLKGDNHSQFDKKKPINELQESSTIPMFSNCYESQSDFHLSFWFHFVQYLDTKLEFQTKYLLQRKNEQNSPVGKKKIGMDLLMQRLMTTVIFLPVLSQIKCSRQKCNDKIARKKTW